MRALDDELYDFASNVRWKVHSVPHVDDVLVVVRILDVSEPVVRGVLNEDPRDWHSTAQS